MTDAGETPERLRRMRALFDAVMDLEPAERARFLAGQAADDSTLRDDVAALITAAERTQERLDASPGALLLSNDVSGGVAAGHRLGAYEIVRLIGRGGMGAVYEAVRADDQYRKRVAIKVVQSGVELHTTLARFRRERQILANLEHANIARLLDGGVTADGRPFLVMEYVEGQPITSWCDARQLTVRERVALFRQACDAVRHAHRNLVIHRDLKPGNIFVTADGTVKLLDFGIAKIIGEDASDDALPLTRGAGVFTPEYASPEQLRGVPLTTASDMYSLGVVLCELLAGHRPVTSRSGPDTTPAVSRPSTLPGPVDAERRRERSADQLRRRLAGDLDQVITMALRVEPDRRYASVDALDDDLRRYLEGYPVTARPDSAGYRLRRFVRRNRTAVAAALVAVLALLGGSGLALWQAKAARREAAKAARVADFLEGILGARLGGGAGATWRFAQADLRLEEVLDSAARRLAVELRDEPEIRAQLHRVFAGGYAQALEVVPAHAHTDSALRIHQQLFGPDHVEVGRDLLLKAMLLLLSRPDTAEIVARRASEILARNRSADTLGEQVGALAVLGQAQSYQGRYPHAESTFVRALTAERARPQPRLAVIGVLYGELGLLIHNRGLLDSAEVAMKHGIAAHDSAAAGPSAELASQLFTLGTALMSANRPAEALTVLRRAQETARATVQPNHSMHLQIGISLADALAGTGQVAGADSVAAAALALIPSLPRGSEVLQFLAEWTYARMLRRQGRLVEAEVAARRQLTTAEASVGGYPHYLSDAYRMLGGALRDNGRFGEAEAHLRAAHRIARERIGPDNMRTVRAAAEVAQLYRQMGRSGQAEEYLSLLPATLADSVRDGTAFRPPTPPARVRQ